MEWGITFIEDGLPISTALQVILESINIIITLLVMVCRTDCSKAEVVLNHDPLNKTPSPKRGLLSRLTVDPYRETPTSSLSARQSSKASCPHRLRVDIKPNNNSKSHQLKTTQIYTLQIQICIYINKLQLTLSSSVPQYTKQLHIP